MKATNLSQPQGGAWRWILALGLCATALAVSAAETNAPAAAAAPKAPETNAPPAAATNAAPATAAAAAAPAKAADEKAPAEKAALTAEQMFEGGSTAYNNWITFGAGGFVTSGNKSQFEQRNQMSGNPFGGIEDLHLQQTVATNTTMTLDGRGIFDEHDYKLSLGIQKEKLGYLRVSASEFRTWYNGDGGYFPPTGTYYALKNNELGLDRSDFSVEGGLTLENKPKVTFKYAHNTREGEKSSTIWGLTNPGGGVGVRGLSPSVYSIDERSDLFQVDVTHTIKKVDVGAGMSYETGRMTDALKIDQFPGEATQQKITDKQGTTYDMLNVHSFAESWVHKNVMLSSGFSYSDLDNDLSGSRIYGSDYDVSYSPNVQNGFGYYGLHGGSHLHEYVGNVNVFTRPWQSFTIVPSIRVAQQSMDANTSATETLSDFATTPFSSHSDDSDLDVRERLDLTYNGITNWVFYARGELTEGNGTLAESGGLVPINGIGVPPINRNTEMDRFFQKYGAGIRWYPARRLTFDVGGYYKRNEYNYDHTLDSTPNDSTSPNRYPAYLVMQNFETVDGNARMTFRPRQNVTSTTRYEYQYATVHTSPDGSSGLPESESSRTLSQIIGQDIGWVPWTRLYLQAGLNYVLNETKTTGLDNTQAVLPAQNNYWTVTSTAGLVVDNKTDLRVSFFYYLADNYVNNSLNGVPYGSDENTYAITATLTRRITERIRWSLKYGYSHSENATYGGHQDYQAHLIYSSLQYRF
jgi:hypothetical protein